ncbi:TetR/AcrR family transcriptional regulator [Streptomyces sp. NPDC089424]|uniref:TetR/AcrR family transcriptional regulator n=1 Tax=Streptomyces sp. NPDC089424 TaxID=3365917 RepID=UPI0037FD45AC
MSRLPDPAKRRRLLGRVREYVLRNGLADLSVRRLAQDLGTSDRMLLYYFGSKERMVAEALAVYERRPLLRTREILRRVGTPTDAASLRRLLEDMWEQFNDPEVRVTLPLYLEIMSASILHPDRYGPVLDDAVTAWTDLLSSVFRDFGMDRGQALTQATLLTDAVFGLLVAPLVDDHWDRADAAFHALLDSLEPSWHPVMS